MTDRVWPGKLWRGSPMYQPTPAASTATIVPASIALTMNGNVSSSRRSVIGLSESCVFTSRDEFVAVSVHVRSLGLADDDHAPVLRSQHLDRGAVELAERRGRDDCLDRAAHRASAGHVDHLVEVAEERVDV